MEPNTGIENRLDDFLAAHEPVEICTAFNAGEMFGDWRVTAFLGRGGSGEVYRVVHATLGFAAALKVCVKTPERDDACDAAVCVRFRREAELLAKNLHASFPRFMGFGERDGRPWYVMELLEHRPLPTVEKEIARFLLAVASGVQYLHSLGLVHRDIKPANILWRLVGSHVPCDRGRAGRASLPVPVLIDLGLVKDTSAERGHSGDSLSIVDGKAIGVGTPRYAAPEQLSGDEVSPATDVYALGMLANECFGDTPPRRWRRIIQRATAAVPVQRYATADSFIRAVKLLQARNWIVGAFIGVLACFAIALLTLPTSKMLSIVESEKTTWRDLCSNFTTNNINAVQVNLGGRNIAFSEPIALEAGREYWIVGPGGLDGQFTDTSTATVHIVNCIFRNRTTATLGKAGVDYVLDGGAYLNFTELPATDAMKVEAEGRIRNNGMSEGRRWWRIKGPNDISELVDEDNKSSLYSATMESF